MQQVPEPAEVRLPRDVPPRTVSEGSIFKVPFPDEGGNRCSARLAEAAHTSPLQRRDVADARGTTIDRLSLAALDRAIASEPNNVGVALPVGLVAKDTALVHTGLGWATSAGVQGR